MKKIKINDKRKKSDMPYCQKYKTFFLFSKFFFPFLPTYF